MKHHTCDPRTSIVATTGQKPTSKQQPSYHQASQPYQGPETPWGFSFFSF